MRTMLRVLMVCLLVPAAAALAQEKPAAAAPDNPLSAWNKKAYTRLKDILLRSAEKMPEENYGFKPSPDVRSFGQQVAHVRLGGNHLCVADLRWSSSGGDAADCATAWATGLGW